MRSIALAAVCMIAFVSCSPPSPERVETPTRDGVPSPEKAGAEASIVAPDASDDAANADTADGFTFHTRPSEIGSVHLPAIVGNIWTATASDPEAVSVGKAKETKMPNGVLHQVVQVTSKKPGYATVKFERRDSADVSGSVLETRTINFAVQ